MQEVGKQNIHGRFSLANPIKFWIFFIFRNKIFVRVFCPFLPYGLNLLISNIKIYRSIIICRLLIRIRLSILYEMESGHKRTGFEPWLRFKKKRKEVALYDAHWPKLDVGRILEDVAEQSDQNITGLCTVMKAIFQQSWDVGISVNSLFFNQSDSTIHVF